MSGTDAQAEHSEFEPAWLIQARAIMETIGPVERQLVGDFTAALYWVQPVQGSGVRAHNGSIFFIDTRVRVLGVTAAHVIRGYENARKIGAGPLLYGPGTVLDLSTRLIDLDDQIDIATLAFTEADVRASGHIVFGGADPLWPPRPPDQDKGIYFAGFPGDGTVWLDPVSISFGMLRGSGVASSVSERDISMLTEREYWMPVRGEDLPTPNFDFRGMSGGPMVTVVESGGIRSWRLAGVLYEGPNPAQDMHSIEGLEIIKARRADFILSDGRLDRGRWSGL